MLFVPAEQKVFNQDFPRCPERVRKVYSHTNERGRIIYFTQIKPLLRSMIFIIHNL